MGLCNKQVKKASVTLSMQKVSTGQVVLTFLKKPKNISGKSWTGVYNGWGTRPGTRCSAKWWLTHVFVDLSFCENQKILWSFITAQRRQSSIGLWRWKIMNWSPVNETSYTTSSNGNHWTASARQKQSTKQRISCTSSEQWFDTCLDNQMPVVFCFSLTWQNAVWHATFSSCLLRLPHLRLVYSLL